MSQLSHPSLKKSQRSQENLLQGLQDSKSTKLFLAEERKHEFEGSMLLDSINHLLKEVQKKYSPIKQVDETDVLYCQKPTELADTEKDDAQTVLQYQIIAPQNYQVQASQSKSQPQNNPQILQQLPSEINDMDSNFLNPNEIKQPLQLTNYNICDSEQKESQVRKDLNSSLFVEVSDRKDLDLSQFMSMAIDSSLGKDNVDEQRENQNEIILNNNQSLQVICQTYYRNEKTAQLQSKHTQLSQNYSLDSSKIIQMIPQEYFQDKNDKIDSKINVIAQKNQQLQLDQYQNKINHYNLEKQIQIPMDIEFESKQRQTPMDIESIGFQYNFNNIAPIRNEQIKQPNYRESQEQLEGQERCQQIQIINSIIEKIPQNDEIFKSKQFTFGKVDNPINICDNKISDQDFNLDTSINSINGNNMLIQDNGNSQQFIKNLSFDHSIDKEPFQNLSLNVQCDNHQLQGLEDLECLIPQSIKNQSRENTKIQKNEIINHLLKETIFIEHSSSQNQEAEDVHKRSQILIRSGLKGENMPIVIQIQDEQRNVENKTDSQQNKINKQIVNAENIMRVSNNQNNNLNVNTVQERNPKQSSSMIQKQDILPLLSVLPNQEPISRKMQINQNKLSFQNNLINYSLNPQTKIVAAGQPSFYQDRNKPQVIIHNDNYNIPPLNNQNYPNNFTFNQSGSYPTTQPHINCYPPVPIGYFRPQISINFRNNEMFVNISGPSTQNTIKCEQAQGKVEEKPDISEDEANKKISQSIVSKVAESIIIKEKDNHINIEDKKSLENTNKLHQITQFQGEKESTVEKSGISPVSLSEQELILKYDFIIQLSEQYLNTTQPSQENHKQFQYHISPFIYIRFTPQPKDLFGSKLFKNGIFLIALVKLISRTSSSAFLANYIIQYFQSAFGLGIEKNTYIFKCQAESFKKKYSEELEKKYLQRIRSDQSKKAEISNSRTQPFKRVVVHNPFLSLKSEKKDEGSQVSPRKTERSTNVSIQTESQQLFYPPQKQVEKTQLSKRYQAFTSNEKQKITKNSEESGEIKSQKSKQASLVKFQKTLSLSQDSSRIHHRNDKNDKDDKSEDIDKSQNKLKRVDDQRSSVGLLIKKGNQPESSNKEQVSRFNDLYEKYRRIRENKKTEPIDNSSIKKNIVEQVAKIQSFQQQPTKRSQRKQVMFSQETITKENEKGVVDQQGEGDNKKKKKVRKSKPKRDSSIEEQCEEQPIPSKTRKNFGKR